MNLHGKIKFPKIFTRTGTRKWIKVGQDITDLPAVVPAPLTIDTVTAN
jgi:hypothetical protein